MQNKKLLNKEDHLKESTELFDEIRCSEIIEKDIMAVDVTS